jgi:hypothetical protein
MTQYQYPTDNSAPLQPGAASYGWGPQPSFSNAPQGHVPPIGSSYPPGASFNHIQFDTNPMAGTSSRNQPMNMSPLPLAGPSRQGGYTSAHAPHSTSGHHGETGSWQCEICGLPFERQSRYLAHMNGHNNVRPFICNGGCGDDTW